MGTTPVAAGKVSPAMISLPMAGQLERIRFASNYLGDT
jgi:hypothetical protein